MLCYTTNMKFSWETIGTVVGILGAAFAVWARFVQLETRVDFSEQVVQELVQEVKEMNSGIQRLELRIARGHCGQD